MAFDIIRNFPRSFYFYSNIPLPWALLSFIFIFDISYAYRKKYSCFEPAIDINPRKTEKTFCALASTFVKLAPSRDKRKNEGRNSTSGVLSTPCWDETPFQVLEKRGAREDASSLRRLLFLYLSLSLSPTTRVAQIMRVTSEEGMHERRWAIPSRVQVERDNDVNSAKEITRRNLGRPFGRFQYRNGETV